MIIVFDLDYTLLDTKKFKQNLAVVMGVSRKVFQDSYRELGFGEQKAYSPEKQLNFLVSHGFVKPEAKKEVLKKITLFLKMIDNFLFPETSVVLSKLKKDGHKLVLLTYGQSAWQKAKIKNLKIKKIFHRIIITSQAKDRKNNFSQKKNERVIFINDNARELLAAKQKLPNIGCILIKGPYSNNVSYNFNKYSLKDIIGLIKKYEN